MLNRIHLAITMIVTGSIGSILHQNANKTMARKLRYIGAICSLVLLLQGCTAPDDSFARIDEAELTEIDTWDFSDLYEDVRIIPLETTEQAMFADVVQTVSNKSMIFVRARYSDSSSDAGIWQFDANGKFLRQVGACGQGPGEYHSADAIVLRNDTLFTFDKYNRNIHLYDAASGRHLTSSQTDGFEPFIGLNTVLPIPGSSNFLISSNVMFDSPPNDNFDLAECNPMQNYFKVILPQKFTVTGYASYGFANPTLAPHNNNEALAILPLNDTIYSVEYKTGLVKPLVKLCVGPEAPEFKAGEKYEEAMQKIEDAKCVTNRIAKIYASKDYLILNQFCGSVVWDLRSRKGWYTLNGWKTPDTNTFPFSPVSIVESQIDNTFVCAYGADEFSGYTHSEGSSMIKMAHNSQPINPDGNNVLVIYKLK